MTSLASDPAVRSKGIGGSDIAALVGVDPFGRTDYDVWLEKRGQAPPRAEMGEQVLWGNVLEDPVAREGARRLGLRIARVNRTLVHRDHPFIIGHVDRRVVGEDAIIEVKTTSLWMAGRWVDESPDEIPIHVQYQVQHYAEVADLARVYVFVLIGGQTLRTFVVERDPAMGAAIVKLCAAFWNDHVLTGIPPEPRTVEDIRSRFPQHVENPIEATIDVASAFDALRDAKARIKAAEADEDAAQDALAVYLAERDALTIGGKTVLTFRTQSARRLDGKSLAADHPDLHESYLTTSSTRVMRITKKG